MIDYDAPPERLRRFSTGDDQAGQSLTGNGKPYQSQGNQADELDAEDEAAVDKAWEEHDVEPKR